LSLSIKQSFFGKNFFSNLQQFHIMLAGEQAKR